MLGRFSHKKPRVGAFAQRPAREEYARSPVQRWLHRMILLGAFVVMVGMLTAPPQSRSFEALDLDEPIASEELRASFYFETPDLAATNTARDQAVETVPDYYRIDRERVQGQLQVLRERIDLIMGHRAGVEASVLEALARSRSSDSVEGVVDAAVAAYTAKLKEAPEWKRMPEASTLSLWLRPDLESLPKREFPEGGGAVARLIPVEGVALTFSYGDLLGDLSRRSLEYILTEGVRASTAGGSQSIVILRDAPMADQQVSSELLISEAPDPEQAVEVLKTWLLDRVKRAAKDTGKPDEWAQLHGAALEMVRPLVIDTIRYDKVYTAGARERAREATPAEMRAIEAGEIIQDRGKRWTAQSRSAATDYLAIVQNEEKPRRRIVSIIVAHMILAGLVIAALMQSVGLLGARATRSFRDATRHLYLALMLLCTTLCVGRVASYFEPTGFILPVASVSILYAILVNIRLAAMVGVLLSALVSIQFGYDWRIMIVHGAMSIAGVFSIYKVRRRSDMATASLKATFVGLLAMSAISLSMDTFMGETALSRLAIIFINGAICLLVVPGALSPLERLFGITTDIQLLEYSDLNNALINELAIKAPATYAHSLMLGQIAEAAAEAIGANGLLARVCAYYHDIGKMKRSEYFSENQQGYNIHDELTPRLSARAIRAHVIQGAEIAREYHLPAPIVAGILEHHGTCRISFFYEQAKEQEKHGDVREEQFRYPGPKPQRPETAILMICDASESGVRSIKNPNEERVREFVNKIVTSRAADRQFDDCNLTLRELDTIAGVVARRLSTSLHTRVAYPSLKEEGSTANVVSLAGGPEA